MAKVNGSIAGLISSLFRRCLQMAQFDAISNDDRQEVARQAAPLLLQLQGPRLGGAGAPVILGNSTAEEIITPQWVNSDAGTPLMATGQTLSIIESRNGENA